MLGGVTVTLPTQLVLGSKYKQLHRSRVREDPWKVCSLQGCCFEGLSPCWHLAHPWPLWALHSGATGSCKNPWVFVLVQGCAMVTLSTPYWQQGRASLIEQMSPWDAQSPFGLSRCIWETQGMVSVTQEDCPMLHPMGLPPCIIPWGTNSCSLPPCSSMHRCQACQDTTTPQSRQAGKAKDTREEWETWAFGIFSLASPLSILSQCWAWYNPAWQWHRAGGMPDQLAWLAWSFPPDLSSLGMSWSGGIYGWFQSELPASLPAPYSPLFVLIDPGFKVCYSAWLFQCACGAVSVIGIACVNCSPMMMTSDWPVILRAVLFCFLLGRQILCMFQCNPRSL